MKKWHCIQFGSVHANLIAGFHLPKTNSLALSWHCFDSHSHFLLPPDRMLDSVFDNITFKSTNEKNYSFTLVSFDICVGIPVFVSKTHECVAVK